MSNDKRPLILMPAITLIAGLLIVITHEILSPHIELNRRQAAEKIYLGTLQLSHAADVQFHSIKTDDPDQLGLRAPKSIYIARQKNRVIGVVLPLTAREGYAGDIDFLLGVDASGKIISVRVLSHRETRDLGDRIEPSKSQWLEQFRGQTFDETQKEQWQLRNTGGKFDGITGATVTSRAVVKAVQQGLMYFAMHRDELLGSANNE